MKKSILCLGVSSLLVFGAQAADVASPSCEEIRLQIATQTGLLPQPNIELLRTIGLNQACQFSAAEVYRGAYGDKPLPVQTPRTHRAAHEDDDD